jgi:hypothetical protein
MSEQRESERARFTPTDVALDVMESEAMLWLMVGSNHVEANLQSLRFAWEAYIDAGGMTWPYTRTRPEEYERMRAIHG